MAFEMNDSYYRCLDELRNRYRGRGVAGNMKAEEAMRARNQAKSLGNGQSCVMFDSRTGVSDSYKSGVYNGSKYMTSDDFVRYFKNRREFYMPEALRKKQQEMAANTVVPQRQNRHASSREMSDGDKTSKEGHLKNTISALVDICKKWFYIEPVEGRIEGKRLRLPLSALSGLAVFTVSLGLIVGGSVMIGSASGEVGELNSTISVLETKKTDLEGKLDMKYDIGQIEKDATELGMIKREHADNQYVSIEVDDDVVVYDGTEENVGFMALLSAFGIQLDK